jgi:hypothetical protein
LASKEDHMVCGACHEFRTKVVIKLRSHWRTDCKWRQKWARVIEHREAGRPETADRVAKRLLGVKSDPMSEDRREYLEQYRKDHAEEIKARAKATRAARKRLRQIMKARSRR